MREAGTVTGAAEKLGLSQPAVSRLVAALEAELGFVIFERSRKRLVLSERGRSFLDEAQSALRSMARLAVLAGELRRGNHGLLRVGAIAPLALGLVARAVALYTRETPTVTIEVEVLGRERQLEELRAGRIDIALAAMSAWTTRSGSAISFRRSRRWSTTLRWWWRSSLQVWAWR